MAIKIKRSISSLPDVILQDILSFLPTKMAIKTSVLSKRWRHLWCGIPSLSFDNCKLKSDLINKTLARYTAAKMRNFYLRSTKEENFPHIDRWIKFAMSRNVENMSLVFGNPGFQNYTFPDFFYINSSLKQLTVDLVFSDTMIPSSVSWTSLQKLSLRCCSLIDESMAKILSGCPLLESLTLHFCHKLLVLDLSKSMRLRTLEIYRNYWVPGPTEIVAPHIHCLRLTNSQLPCTLVDVASLTEAKLEICIGSFLRSIKADFLQVMVLKMLKKLQNVEKLSFGRNFLQILSLAEVCGVPFPMLKVKALTLETVIFRYVIPGIERLLQNSPDLEKLTIRARDCNTIRDEYFDNYLNSRGLNPDLCWRSKDGISWNMSSWNVKSKNVASFVEFVLRNTKTLNKLVVLLNERTLALI